MSGAWITQMTHFLDARGRLPSGGVRPLVRFFGSIVIAVASLPGDEEHALGVGCRCRPERRRCTGEIRGRRQVSSGEIMWPLNMKGRR